METLKDFVTAAVLKSGIQTDDSKFVEIIKALDESETGKLELPEGLNGGFGKLLTLDAAKNNVELKNHFVAGAFDGIDTDMMSEASELGFTEEQISELKSEKSTGKKRRLFSKYQKENAEKRINELQGDENNALEDLKNQLKAANTNLAAVKTDYEDKLKAVAEKHRSFVIQGKLKQAYSDYNWTDSIPKDLRTELALIRHNQKLNELKAVAVVESDGSVKIKQSDHPDMDLFDEKGNPYTVKSIADMVMNENKFIKTVPGDNNTGGEAPRHLDISNLHNNGTNEGLSAGEKNARRIADEIKAMMPSN